MLTSLLKNNIVIVLVGVVALAGVLYVWQTGGFTKPEPSVENSQQIEQQFDEDLFKNENKVPAQDQAGIILEVLAFGKISGARNVWFTAQGGVFVEYDTAEGVRAAYFKKDEFGWQRLAVYGEGETGLELIEGEEDPLYLDPPQDLWTYNETSQKWEKAN